MSLTVTKYCGKIMNYPLRNLIYEKIKQAGNMTDYDLINVLTKDEVPITEADLNKALLDLEIYGLVRVSWVTKDKRRIEAGLVDPSIG
jgi:DNA-binding PadR family transcriptional regulator